MWGGEGGVPLERPTVIFAEGFVRFGAGCGVCCVLGGSARGAGRVKESCFDAPLEEALSVLSLKSTAAICFSPAPDLGFIRKDWRRMKVDMVGWWGVLGVVAVTTCLVGIESIVESPTRWSLAASRVDVPRNRPCFVTMRR